MSNFKRYATCLLVLLCLAAVGVLTWSPPSRAQAPHDPYAPIDLNLYCVMNGQASAAQTGIDAYSWRCLGADGNQHAMDLNLGCRQQYGLDFVAVPNAQQSNGWACLHWAGPNPAFTLIQWCRQHTGDANAFVTLESFDHQGWRCVANGGMIGFDLNAICKARGDGAVASYVNQADVRGYACVMPTVPLPMSTDSVTCGVLFPETESVSCPAASQKANCTCNFVFGYSWPHCQCDALNTGPVIVDHGGCEVSGCGKGSTCCCSTIPATSGCTCKDNAAHPYCQ